MGSKKKIRIGFDLDGVIIGKPPLVPKFVMEKLVRKRDHGLSYRYPKTELERWIRWLSHYPAFRPPIRKNIKLIHELYESREYKLFVVSSRYSFLKERTDEWFEFYGLKGLFEQIYINTSDMQPHLYKEKMIKKLKLNVFIDDDRPLLEYLKNQLKGVDLVFVEEQEKYINGK
jgi:hypothetical protein